MRLKLGLGLSRAGAGAAPSGDWYEADAIFAWNSITDTDNAQIDPVIGSAVPLVTGAGATIGSGLWDMDGIVYSNVTTALISDLDRTKPVLIAHAIDEDNHVTNFVSVFKVGSSFRCQLALSGSNQPRYDWFGTASAGVRCEEAAMSAGLKIYWTYFNLSTSFVHAGINQTENTTGGPVAFAPTTGIGRDVVVGSDNATARSAMKHGSLQIVNRTGMTLTDAKAIVQKMQTLHGI
jgi:hypothetical protein